MIIPVALTGDKGVGTRDVVESPNLPAGVKRPSESPSSLDPQIHPPCPSRRKPLPPNRSMARNQVPLVSGNGEVPVESVRLSPISDDPS